MNKIIITTLKHSNEIPDKFHGAILSRAVGDCIGVHPDFDDMSFQPVNDMIGGRTI
ncbi:hypothetical protein [Methanobacterium sp.]|uniref:hypothetical protein n=1 Tax=Methanobacterium sp. TaxID=2164 RepID=UPI002ABA9F74|nr:hypothetical protein [Methanobacterium sp.]MDY9924362.1 hypothetical protein [Methanobacterium sp.]